MKTINFPEDFIKRPHPNFVSSERFKDSMPHLYDKYKNAIQYCYPSFDDIKISVISGTYMFYCDGSDDSFEMYDLRDDEPKGYLTKDQINEHLQNNPL